jgi:hypothetical protein
MSRKAIAQHVRAFQHGSCLRKRRHATPGAAQAACNRHKRQTGEQMRFYRCGFCGLYHITHEESGR